MRRQHSTEFQRTDSCGPGCVAARDVHFGGSLRNIHDWHAQPAAQRSGYVFNFGMSAGFELHIFRGERCCRRVDFSGRDDNRKGCGAANAKLAAFASRFANAPNPLGLITGRLNAIFRFA